MASSLPASRNDVASPNQMLAEGPAPSAGISEAVDVIKASSAVEQFITANMAALWLVWWASRWLCTPWIIFSLSLETLACCDLMDRTSS